MEKYKVSSARDDGSFVITDSYRKLYKILKSLKKSRGKIIHVVGAPGTGKSANIFHAIDEIGLKVYNVKFSLKSGNESSKEVFNKLFEDLQNDLGLKSKKDVYIKLSTYDAVLIADRFHDSHSFNPSEVGFSQWVDKAGFSAFYFYLLCIMEYLKNRKYFKNMNLMFQTAWKVHFNGKKYDTFTDFGFLSKIVLNILKLLFCVVEISYSKKETIEIVKMHVKDADTESIKRCIQKYGFKPRFICNALEK